MENKNKGTTKKILDRREQNPLGSKILLEFISHTYYHLVESYHTYQETLPNDKIVRT